MTAGAETKHVRDFKDQQRDRERRVFWQWLPIKDDEVLCNSFDR